MEKRRIAQNPEINGDTVKRILVLSADAGYGHRSAARAIVAALAETHGGVCHVEMVNPLDDKRVLTLLRESQNDYDKLVMEMPKLYELGYDATDGAVGSTVVEGALVVMLFEVMRDILRRFRPHAIITTYPLYQAPLRAVFIIENYYIPLLSVITDLSMVHGLWFNKSADFCMTPTESVYNQAINHGLDPRKVHITGIPVHPSLAQARDRTILRSELGWSQNGIAVLAVGSKRVEHLGDTLRALNHSGLPLQLIVVAGGDDALYQHLQTIEWHTDIHIYNFVTNLPEMMHAADFIICKAGGLIVSESLACGLPLLLIDVLPGQETGNADYVVDHNAGDLARGALDALESTYHWLENDKALLVEKASNAKRLGHPRAAYDVADRAWAAAQLGPMRRKERNMPKHHRLITLLDRYRIPWQH